MIKYLSGLAALVVVLFVIPAEFSILAAKGKTDMSASSLQKEDTFTNLKATLVPNRDGINVWLVKRNNSPLVNINFGFKGGSIYDPADKAGLSRLGTTVMSVAAGDYDSEQFRKMLDKKGISLGLSYNDDFIKGAVSSMKIDMAAAIDALQLMLNEPRFDGADIEQEASSIVSQTMLQKQDPNFIALMLGKKLQFGDHPYGRGVDALLKSVKNITRQDLQQWYKQRFGKDNLSVVVVGDLTVDEAGNIIDYAFGSLPDKSKLAQIDTVKVSGGGDYFSRYNIPQTVINFFAAGIPYDDPEYHSAKIVNNIIADSGLTSRLFKELRDKRGLTYYVNVGLNNSKFASVLAGHWATRTDKAGESIDIVRKELSLIADKGPTKDELENTKKLLTGKFDLYFLTSGQIAENFNSYQLYGLPLNYPQIYKQNIRSVTLDQAKMTARRLFGQQLSFVAIGRDNPFADAKEVGNIGADSGTDSLQNNGNESSD